MRARKNNRETKTEKRKTKKKEGNETESGAKAPTSNSELILDQKKKLRTYHASNSCLRPTSVCLY